MNEREQMVAFLNSESCPKCGEAKMELTGEIVNDLWMWECSNCGEVGNVGYNVHEILRIDLPPDKEEEFKRDVVDCHAFIEKYGIPRPKTSILLNQDPSEY
jgi:predicted RNA-binding Zn-ribbon protein involved in translation (DUF1610 family)